MPTGSVPSPYSGAALTPLRLQTTRPSIERGHQLLDELAGGFVREFPRGVELGVRGADENLGLVERVHVEEHARAPQIVLRATGAERAGGGAHDRDRLVGERLRGQARQPIDRVLERARDAEIVFR